MSYILILFCIVGGFVVQSVPAPHNVVTGMTVSIGEIRLFVVVLVNGSVTQMEKIPLFEQVLCLSLLICLCASLIGSPRLRRLLRETCFLLESGGIVENG